MVRMRIPCAAVDGCFADFEVSLKHGGSWRPYRLLVPTVDVDERALVDCATVIPTVDTVRLTAILRTPSTHPNSNY